MKITESQILEALSNVIEPDLKKDVVELGFVSNIEIENKIISFSVKVVNPAMHSKKRMEEACEFAVQRILGNDITVNCDVIADVTEKIEPVSQLAKVKNIVAIASGKGGVGKSTITSNLAVGLAQKGFKVGLIDADIYGPSMPTMFDCVHEKPRTVEVDGKHLIVPVESHGVKLLSIGFFAEINQAVVWRGPMASKAIKQMILDTQWGELDYLLLDLPPGTGDIHLTIIQSAPLTAAVVVSTPQEVALADARKGIAMFQLDSVNVPVVGLIENMAWFTPEELPEYKYYIFGKDGVKSLSEKTDIPLLAQVPLVQSAREAGDAGRPAILQKGTAISNSFNKLCDEFTNVIEERNQTKEPTQKVVKTH